jgi:hypothetical protein
MALHETPRRRICSIHAGKGALARARSLPPHTCAATCRKHTRLDPPLPSLQTTRSVRQRTTPVAATRPRKHQGIAAELVHH